LVAITRARIKILSLVRGSWRNAFMQDLLLTTLTSVLTALAAVVTTRILAQGLGPEQFGAYSLARRLFATLTPVLTLSMAIAIPRYMAMARERSTSDRFFLSGLMLGLLPGALAAGAILMLFGDQLTQLVFHSNTYRLLLLATIVSTVGYLFYAMLYGFYRGQSQMRQANLWQIFALGIGPLVAAALLSGMRRADLIMALSAIPMFLAAIPIAVHAAQALSRSGGQLRLGGPLRQMASYGLPRIPAGFALSGIFAIGPLLAPYFASLADAGYLAAGQSVQTAIQAVVIAFGLVALPKISQMVAQGRQDAVKQAVKNVIGFTLHLGLFFTLQGVLWTDELVLVLLGPQYLAAIPLMRIVLASLVPYLAYVMLRSVVDAVEDKAINTVNLFIAVAVTVLVGAGTASLGLKTMGLAIGMTVGQLVLGILTIYFLVREYQIRWQSFFSVTIVLLNAGCFVVGFLVKAGLEARLHGTMLVIGAVTIAAGLSLIYMYALQRARVEWLVDLERRLGAGRAKTI
jgi:stage V sporulation protein B